jgi:hypothetical protein
MGSPRSPTEWIPYYEPADDDVFYEREVRRFAGLATMEAMRDENKPLTITWYALDTGYTFLLSVASRSELEDESKGIAPFRVPNPETGGGWVAVLHTQTVAHPSVPGPWRNYGGGFGPKRMLWVNERGEWGYSEHHATEKDNLYDMEGSLEALRKTIRPVREIEGFEMIPEKRLKEALEENAKAGWPLERLVALARGDFEVENPAMKYWK